MSNIITQKRNLSHKPFFEDKNRWLISYGGAGSAKSYSTGQKILLDRIMQEPNHRYLVVRKVATTLRASVFQLFRDLISQLEEFNNFKINKSDMTIEYMPNGSQLLFFGLENIEKLKSIQGISSIWIEEASECDQGDILELNRRLRGATTSYKQIILTFNPISHLHWLKQHFFDNPNSTASIYKTTYLDNKFMFQYNCLCRFEFEPSIVPVAAVTVSIQLLVSVRACKNGFNLIGYKFQYNCLCRFEPAPPGVSVADASFNTTACVGSRVLLLPIFTLRDKFQYNCLCRFEEISRVTSWM